MAKSIIFLCADDWAGSCDQAVRAINSIGNDIEAEQIVLRPHVFDYPHGVLNPSASEARVLFEQADLIHIWNEEIPAFKHLEIPVEKVRSCTFTGSHYRRNHAVINKRLAERRIRLVVQNPMFRAYNMDAELIPHAVDTEALTPLSIEDRVPHSIGCYRPSHGNTSAKRDIAELEKVWPGEIKLTRHCSWAERLKQLATCQYYFEYMDETMGYWGRSVIEACALGIPVFTYICNEAMRLSDGRYGDFVPLFPVKQSTLDEDIHKGLRADYERSSNAVRAWVEIHYSYETVGRLYSDFFEEIWNV